MEFESTDIFCIVNRLFTQLPHTSRIFCFTTQYSLTHATLWHVYTLFCRYNGILGDYPTNSHDIAPQILRDARVFRIFEGPTETLNMFLGSRVIQKGEQLDQFLSETLAVPEVAELLNNAKQKVRDRITNNSRFSENHTALPWKTTLFEIWRSDLIAITRISWLVTPNTAIIDWWFYRYFS